MLNFIKKYGLYIFLILVIAGGFFYFQKQLYEKNSQIYVRDSLIQDDSVRFHQLAEQYTTEKQARLDLEKQNKELAKLIEDANLQIRSFSQLLLKIKSQTFTHIDTIHIPFTLSGDTILVPIGQDSVQFAGENDIVKIGGSTFLYPRKGYIVTLEGKPFPLDIVVAEDRNGAFFAYVDTHSPDLELSKITTRVLPYQKSFWENVGFLGGIELTTRNSSLKLGAGYKDWYGYVTGGYDYKDLNIDKTNLYYGIGVIKLF